MFVVWFFWEAQFGGPVLIVSLTRGILHLMVCLGTIEPQISNPLCVYLDMWGPLFDESVIFTAMNINFEQMCEVVILADPSP